MVTPLDDDLKSYVVDITVVGYGSRDLKVADTSICEGVECACEPVVVGAYPDCDV